MLVVNPSQQMREWLWGTTSCWWPLVVSRANSLCPAAIFPTCSPFAPSRFVCRDCCDTCVSAFGQRPCACGVVTLQDAQNIVAALPGVSNVVVVGTSFIGVESAAGIRGKNDVRPLLRCVSCPLHFAHVVLLCAFDFPLFALGCVLVRGCVNTLRLLA
jgi:hypothetical protein